MTVLDRQDTMPLSRQVRARARLAAAQLRTGARRWRAAITGWKITHAAPGLAGCALISVAAGLRFGLWAGLAAGGVFLLRIDARL